MTNPLPLNPLAEKPHAPSPSEAPSLPSRIAVFGGSFDPVHNGHLFLAGEVLRLEAADEVLFVPARTPPHKQNQPMAAPEHRLAMLEAALESFDSFLLSDIELRRTDVPSYTIDTLETLRAVYPGSVLLFLMGMDSLRELHLWHRATELVNRFGFLIVPRPEFEPPSFAELSGRFGWKNARKLLNSILPARRVPISATEIRSLCGAAKPLAGLAPESVLRYIRTHDLYSDRLNTNCGAGGTAASVKRPKKCGADRDPVAP